MAKYECRIETNITQLADFLRSRILDGSVSASYEDGWSASENGVRVLFDVYERYSYAGGNRVSLSLTLADLGDGVVRLCAITSGGSQAMFWKVNTWGEEAFLEKLSDAVEEYRRSMGCK